MLSTEGVPTKFSLRDLPFTKSTYYLLRYIPLGTAVPPDPPFQSPQLGPMFPWLFDRNPCLQHSSGMSTPTASFFSDGGSSRLNPSSIRLSGAWYSPALLWRGISPRSIAMVCAMAAIAVRSDPTLICFQWPSSPVPTIAPKLVMWWIFSL